MLVFGFCLRLDAAAADPALPTTISGEIGALTLPSKILDREVKLWVWLPPGYHDAANAARKYPVLYLLDGDDMFDAKISPRGRDYQVDEILTRLIGEGKIEPVIAVAIGKHPANDIPPGEGRHDEFLPYPDPQFFPDRAYPRGQVYPRFLVTEALPFIAGRYHVTDDYKQTAIAGVSYGGVAALYALIQQPRKIGRAIIESIAPQVGNGQLVRDTEHLFFGGDRVALGVGTEETGPENPKHNQAWVRSVETIARNLEAADLPPKVQLTVEPGGRHGGAAFTRRLPADLIFLFGVPPQAAVPAAKTNKPGSVP